MNFAEDHILLLTDQRATKKNIDSSLGSLWLPRVARPDDLVVIFFSTHGSSQELDLHGVNYLIAHDTEVNNLFPTAIQMQELTSVIRNRISAKRIVIFIDACHSAASTAGSKMLHREINIDAKQLSQGTGQLVVSSSQVDQRSWESKSSELGVFTKYLIDGLWINGINTCLGEAFEHLKKKVQEEVYRDRNVWQTPVLSSEWKGDDLVLAVIPADPIDCSTDLSYFTEQSNASFKGLPQEIAVQFKNLPGIDELYEVYAINSDGSRYNKKFGEPDQFYDIESFDGSMIKLRGGKYSKYNGIQITAKAETSSFQGQYELTLKAGYVTPHPIHQVGSWEARWGTPLKNFTCDDNTLSVSIEKTPKTLRLHKLIGISQGNYEDLFLTGDLKEYWRSQYFQEDRPLVLTKYDGSEIVLEREFVSRHNGKIITCFEVFRGTRTGDHFDGNCRRQITTPSSIVPLIDEGIWKGIILAD